MSNDTTDKKENESNPFLTERAEFLWRKLDKGGAPVSKEELLKRAQDLRKKQSK